jgi:hypothetical protein
MRSTVVTGLGVTESFPANAADSLVVCHQSREERGVEDFRLDERPELASTAELMVPGNVTGPSQRESATTRTAEQRLSTPDLTHLRLAGC